MEAQRKFTVLWEIDVSAHSPELAAAEAFGIAYGHRSPEDVDAHFLVTEHSKLSEGTEPCEVDVSSGVADAPVNLSGPPVEYRVQWNITLGADSPRKAAVTAWTHIFGREAPSPDDASVFTVTDDASGKSYDIDLSENDAYRLEEIEGALNAAADDVLGAVDSHGEQITDIVNLVVNAAQHYLDNPRDLDEAIHANYDASQLQPGQDIASEVRGWINDPS